MGVPRGGAVKPDPSAANFGCRAVLFFTPNISRKFFGLDASWSKNDFGLVVY